MSATHDDHVQFIYKKAQTSWRCGTSGRRRTCYSAEHEYIDVLSSEGDTLQQKIDIYNENQRKNKIKSNTIGILFLITWISLYLTHSQKYNIAIIILVIIIFASSVASILNPYKPSERIIRLQNLVNTNPSLSTSEIYYKLFDGIFHEKQEYQAEFADTFYKTV